MIRIRSAERADLNKIVQVHSLSAMKAYDGFLSSETLQATFAQRILRGNWNVSFALKEKDPSKRALLVAEDPEKPELGILGVARCHLITNRDERAFFDEIMGDKSSPESLSEIQTLYIHPDCQNQGVGLALMTEMAKFLSKAGNKKSVVITLDGYDASAKFYQKIGQAKLAGQFVQNTAETAGAANPDAEASKFNLWLFDNILKCCHYEKSRHNILNIRGGRE